MFRWKKVPFMKVMIASALLGLTLPVGALRPLDGLLLGTFSDQYKKDLLDPISYIFANTLYQEATEDSVSPYKEHLALYRGFIQEGHNLKQSCDRESKPYYNTVQERTQVKRSLLATMQYIGLDLTARYLPHYASYFEFSADEYKNLIDGLVGNYCSQNLSTISLRQLKKNLLFKFKHKDKVELPSILDNPLFPDRLDRINRVAQNRKREFLTTIELFKSFCSWGGETDNLRLLVPFMKDPTIYSFLTRQMVGESIAWNSASNKTTMIPDKRTRKVYCENFICRKVSYAAFERLIPRAIGTTSLKKDFERLYCHDLRKEEYKIRDQVPQIKKMIKGISFDDQRMMTGQMIALITRVPHFLLYAKEWSQGQEYFRASVDRLWDDWSAKQKELYRKNLLYEESLSIELVKRKSRDLSLDHRVVVDLDINMGEFDRVSQITGKLKNTFHVHFTKEYVSWLSSQLASRRSDQDIIEMSQVITSMEERVRRELLEVDKKMDLVPWKKGIEKIIVGSILDQLANNQKVFTGQGTKKLTVPVHLNYGLFALRYIRYIHKSEKAKKDREEDEKRQKALREALASRSRL